MKNFKEFLDWEKTSKDTKYFKKVYVDMADDLIAGLVLSELIYWYLPSKDNGKNKLRVIHEGEQWIAARYKDWWERCRITESQAERAIRILISKNLIEKRVFKFDGEPTVHLKICQEEFLSLLQQRTNSVTTENETVLDRYPLTETTTETTSKNTTEIKEEVNQTEKLTYPEGNPFYLNKQNMQFQDADLLILDRVYTDVTGMFPSNEVPRIRQAIKLIAEKNNLKIIPANESKIADILRPYYLAMLKRKNKNGQNYSRSGLFWLFEWAATGEIPQKQDETQKPDDITKRYKPVADYKI